MSPVQAPPLIVKARAGRRPKEVARSEFLAQRAKERPHVDGQSLRLLHGGEVPAPAMSQSPIMTELHPDHEFVDQEPT